MHTLLERTCFVLAGRTISACRIRWLPRSRFGENCLLSNTAESSRGQWFLFGFVETEINVSVRLKWLRRRFKYGGISPGLMPQVRPTRVKRWRGKYWQTCLQPAECLNRMSVCARARAHNNESSWLFAAARKELNHHRAVALYTCTYRENAPFCWKQDSMKITAWPPSEHSWQHTETSWERHKQVIHAVSSKGRLQFCPLSRCTSADRLIKLISWDENDASCCSHLLPIMKDYISRLWWLFPVPVILTSMSKIHWSVCFRAFLCPLSIVFAMERYVHFCFL